MKKKYNELSVFLLLATLASILLLASIQIYYAFFALVLFSLYLFKMIHTAEHNHQRSLNHLMNKLQQKELLLLSQQQENLAYWQSLIDVLATPFFFADKNGSITLFNNDFLVLCPEKYLSVDFQKFVNNCLLLEQQQTTTLKIQKKYYTILATPLLQQNKQFQGSFFLLTDVTDVKELQISQQTFISYASHELKTPLTVIKGAAEILHQAVATTDATEFTQMIDHEVAHMEFIIQQLLMLSKLKSKTYILNIKKFELCRKIQDSILRLQSKAQMKKIHIAFHSIEAIYYYGDVDKIEQVITNLIANAIKYGDTQSSIVIALSQTETTIHCSFQNNCNFISPQDCKRIFLPFYRLSDSSKGNGLGLAITKEIVELHKGSIHALYDQGTKTITFTMSLPK